MQAMEFTNQQQNISKLSDGSHRKSQSRIAPFYLSAWMRRISLVSFSVQFNTIYWLQDSETVTSNHITSIRSLWLAQSRHLTLVCTDLLCAYTGNVVYLFTGNLPVRLQLLIPEIWQNWFIGIFQNVLFMHNLQTVIFHKKSVYVKFPIVFLIISCPYYPIKRGKSYLKTKKIEVPNNGNP